MQTIRQAFILLRQNPLLSTIFILGTAFAITMIMAIVITWQMKYVDIEPEVNRSRSLYISKMHLQGKENKGWNNYTACSPAFMKDCVQPLPEVEACTAFVPASVALVSMPDGTNAVKVDAMETDPGFWKVFRMQFVAGRGFDDSDRGGDVSAIVVVASVARGLFGTTDAVGREFLLNHAPYRVAGVVKDVSTLANCAYGQVWVPYTSTGMDKEAWNDRHMGMMSCTMLAHSRDDFPAIRQEAERRKLEYNTLIGKDGWELIYRNRPYDQEKNAIAFGANIEPDVDAARRQRIMIFVILLIVPAINLSSMTQSRLRQRVSEIGVRRAFGSTRAELMGQIIAENLVVTLLAGIVGLLLSVAFAYMGNTLLFAQEFSQTLNPPEVDASILLHASTFAWALLFCFVLNLMSSGFPAWRAARIGIVNALGGRLH